MATPLSLDTIWVDENRRRLHNETKGDLLRAAEMHFRYASYFSAAGLHDEAVAELQIMLEQPGGFRFPFVESMPFFDELRDHPGYVALRERFGE